jgi:hypothetical protein
VIRQGTIELGEEGAVPIWPTSARGGHLIIQALLANEGAVHIGDSDVDDESGISLEKGDVLPTIRVDDLSTLWVAGAEGDGVSFIVSGPA